LPARERDAAGDLFAVEGLALAVALHDHEPGGLFDPLVGREAAPADLALAAATDDVAALARARVDDAVLICGAVRTDHGFATPCSSAGAHTSARAEPPRACDMVRSLRPVVKRRVCAGGSAFGEAPPT